jgi:hypothetical protein
MEREIKVKSDCSIGAGYTTCMDIGFHAVDMFKAISNELSQLGPLKPHIHSRIANLREFSETFLHYFSLGVNAERVAVSL